MWHTDAAGLNMEGEQNVDSVFHQSEFFNIQPRPQESKNLNPRPQRSLSPSFPI